MKSIGYTAIANVLAVWDNARFASKDFEYEFGMVVLERLFELHPRTKIVFGYDKGEEEGQISAQVHAKAFASLIDSIFQMLGPDIDFTEEILIQVGRKHKAVGVSPSYIPFMGEALIYALEKSLGTALTEEQRNSWHEVFESISNVIIKALLE